jgi:transposase-like protein
MKTEKRVATVRCQRCGSANLESVGSDSGHWHAICVDCGFAFIVEGDGPISLPS